MQHLHRVIRHVLLAMAGAAIAWSAADFSVRAAALEQQGGNRIDVLILFRSRPGAAEVDDVRRLGGQIKYAYRIVPAVAANLPEAAVVALRNNPRVIAVDPDVEITASDLELDNTWGVKHVGAGDVHATGNKGVGVTVAVLDSGIDYHHAEFDDSYLDGHDFVNGDTDPRDDRRSRRRHRRRGRGA